MLPPGDPFRPYLKELLDFNYLPYVPVDREDLPSPRASPVSFYDLHLDSNLTLKSVVQLPSVPHAFSKICDKAIQTFIKNGHSFTLEGFKVPAGSGSFGDVGSVSRYYASSVGKICHQLPSKLYLHPSALRWMSAFDFKVKNPSFSDFAGEGWLQLTYLSTGKLTVHQNVRAALDQATVDKLEDLIQKYPRLAHWQFFAASDEAVTMLQTITQDTEFLWGTARTKGFRTVSHSTRPLDATTGILQSSGLKKRTKRPAGKRTPHDRKVITSAYVSPPTQSTVQRSYRVNFRHYIQRAWARAVVDDSTFIIFHCGQYERIGIRHRESQTLYLSGLIDPFNIRDPPYRKLHAGLHTAIVKDALERQQLTNALAESVGTSQKAGRKRSMDQVDDVETSGSKRQKTAPPSIGVVERAKIDRELSTRRLALVNLDYGPYCSPVPSSFSRIGSSCAPGLFDLSFVKTASPTTGYRKNEYSLLTLRDSIGHGAVGVVHLATLQMSLESGEVLRDELIVKLAFSEDQKEKLHHEFRVYSHFAQSEGVRGIVTVHGLFEDAESGTLALLMASGGRTLRVREKERTGILQRQVSTSDEEHKAFMDALESIHRAGVVHLDLRADNLLIDSSNAVYIIDFDCADFNVQSNRTEYELMTMDDILTGNYRP